MSVTGDESWFVSYSQHSKKGSVGQDEVSMRVSQAIGAKKVISRVIWRIDGFHVLDMIAPRGCFKTSTSVLILGILCWQTSFRSEGKAMDFD
jgi:hypothetical protein